MDTERPPAEGEHTTLGKRERTPQGGESEPGTVTSRSTTENHEDTATTGTLSPLDANLSNKRARTLDPSSRSPSVDQPGSIPEERRGIAQLPAEILQHILSFLEPVSLGRMLRVNTIFNVLLDPHKLPPTTSAVKGCLYVRSQNSIWAASRKRFLLGFPRPLSEIFELDMWKLLCETSCQFCGKKRTNQTSSFPPSPWSAGPGPDGVRVIWPFAIRACGSCLSSRLVKEAELMFSSFPSFLQPGLPYAYFTPSLDFVTSISLRLTSAPSGLLLTKHYFRPQMEELQKEMDEVRTLGPGAAEGWCNGLESTGREKLADAARFEQWEATGGFQALNGTRNSSRASTNSPALLPISVSSIPARMRTQSRSSGSRTQSPISTQQRPTTPSLSLPLPGSLPTLPLKPSTPAPGLQPTNFNSNHAPGTVPSHKAIQHHRPERNLRDVAQMKADRRAEIERRCLELHPPIMPSTLKHMDAFAAAIQISMALNDNAWDMLKGRLLGERDLALQKESKASNKQLPTQPSELCMQAEQPKQTQEDMTPDWEEIQRPARDRLNRYADDFIQTRWNGGDYVTKDNAAQFAADVLLFVRRRFFEVLEDEDRLLAAQGRSVPPDSPGGSNRILKLENMKWVYDSKIKPLAERHGKELFRCGACDGNSKYYALDAVIQHYAAKHTSRLSHGAAVVYWKAEWPADPPFDPEPMNKPNRGHDTQSVYAASPMYTQEALRSFLQENSASQVEPTHPEIFNGLYALQTHSFPESRNPPSVYSVGEEKTQRPPSFVPFQQASSRHPTYHNGYANGAQYTPSLPPSSPAFPAHGLPQYPQVEPSSGNVPVPGSLQRQGHLSGNVSIHALSQGFPAVQGFGHQPSKVQNFGIYRVQIEDLARNAREVWEGTEDVQYLPNSVRIYVIIHHVVLRFSEKYTNEPNLALFTDGLNNNPQMKPLQSLARLTCKTCVSLQKETETGPDGLPTSEIIQEVYTLLDLLKHFQSVHIEHYAPRAISQIGIETARPDWKFDMIQLPEDPIITNLIHSPGITHAKFNLIATVLPRLFPQPLPRVGSTVPAITARGSDVPNGNQALPRNLDDPIAVIGPRIEDNALIPLAQEAGRHDLLRQSPVEGRRVVEVVREDEYDPHRPAPTFYVARPHERGDRVPVYHVHDPTYAYYEPVVSRDIYPQPQERYAQPGGRIRVVYPEDDYLMAPRRDNPPRRYYYPEEEPERFVRPSPIRSRTIARPYAGHDGALTGARDSDRLESREQFVKEEDLKSPVQEPASAAERFLNSFDTMAESYNDDHHRDLEIQSGVLNRSSHNASSVKDMRDFDESRRDRLNDFEKPRTGLSSARGTPRDVGPLSGASAHSRSPLAIAQPNSPEGQTYSPRMAEVQTYLRGGESPDAQDAHTQENQGQTGLPLDEYDEEKYPRQDRSHDIRRPVERSIYRDPQGSPPRHERTNRYVTRSPELNRREYRTEYQDELPLLRYRRADEDLYGRAPREPVQYVRIMPHERYSTGEYYVDRPSYRDVQPQYVEHDGKYGEVLYQRDGQLYRAPPYRRSVRQEVYEDDGPYT